MTFLRDHWRLTSAVLIAVALSVALGWQVRGWQSDMSAGDRSQDAVKLARSAVLDLTALDSKTIRRNLATLAAEATGNFQHQLVGFTTTFEQVVSKQGLQAQGIVDADGLVSSSPLSAKVIVASSVGVTANDATSVSPRTYRILVSLVRGKGRWLIDGMAFVA